MDMEKGCVMVYNEDGKFFWYFGRKNEEISGNGYFVLLIGMVFDFKEEVFYICDWGLGFIQIYKLDGIFFGVFFIDGCFMDIVLLFDGNLVVILKDD